MKLTLKRTICITLASAVITLAPDVRAAHATNFLNALQTEVTNRVAELGTNITRAQRRALSGADRALNRNTKTFAADLGALASASAQLNARFAHDTNFATLEDQALDAYSIEAHAELETTFARIGTNNISRRLSNQVARAESALDHADSISNSVPRHAHALASAFNKIRVVSVKVRRLFPVPPVPPFEAPLSLDGLRVTAVEADVIVNDRTSYYLNGANYTFFSDNPEELGIWTYQRTALHVGVITLKSNYPVGDYAERPLNLTFTHATGGTFTGTDQTGAAFHGVFIVEPQPD